MKKMESFWFRPLMIARTNSRLYFPAPDIVSLNLGIRELDSFVNKQDAFHKTIYCFGGSTTFGHGVAYENSWPKQLDIDNYTSFNCGSVKSDLKASIFVLIELLRLGHRPSIVIFYDGVNENTGYTIWDRSIPHYVDYDTQFFALREIVFRYRALTKRINSLVYFILGQPFLRIVSFFLKEKNLNKRFLFLKVSKKYTQRFFSKSDLNPKSNINSIKAAALSYTNSKLLISSILEKLGVEKTFFFLQPTIWDLHKKESDNERHKYLKKLYEEILLLNPDVIDISEICGTLLEENMFFDWNHLDERGNENVAKVIKNFLQDSNAT